MIVKTEAMVLKTLKYRDTSKIATLFTRDFGKLSVIAKGARQRMSKFGGSLDCTNHVQAVLYKKEGRDLHLLSQCDLLSSFGRITEDVERLRAAMSIMELLNAVTHPEEVSPRLFYSALGALQTIDRKDCSAATVLLHFETHLLDILGFRPDLHSCAHCKTPLGRERTGTLSETLRLNSYGVVCGACARRGLGVMSISPGALRILQKFQDAEQSSQLVSTVLSRGAREDVRSALWHFLRNQIDGMRTLKVDAVFSALA